MDAELEGEDGVAELGAAEEAHAGPQGVATAAEEAPSAAGSSAESDAPLSQLEGSEWQLAAEDEQGTSRREAETAAEADCSSGSGPLVEPSSAAAAEPPAPLAAELPLPPLAASPRSSVAEAAELISCSAEADQGAASSGEAAPAAAAGEASSAVPAGQENGGDGVTPSCDTLLPGEASAAAGGEQSAHRQEPLELEGSGPATAAEQPAELEGADENPSAASAATTAEAPQGEPSMEGLVGLPALVAATAAGVPQGEPSFEGSLGLSPPVAAAVAPAAEPTQPLGEHQAVGAEEEQPSALSSAAAASAQQKPDEGPALSQQCKPAAEEVPTLVPESSGQGASVAAPIEPTSASMQQPEQLEAAPAAQGDPGPPAPATLPVAAPVTMSTVAATAEEPLGPGQQETKAEPPLSSAATAAAPAAAATDTTAGLRAVAPGEPIAAAAGGDEPELQPAPTLSATTPAAATAAQTELPAATPQQGRQVQEQAEASGPVAADVGAEASIAPQPELVALSDPVPGPSGEPAGISIEPPQPAGLSSSAPAWPQQGEQQDAGLSPCNLSECCSWMWPGAPSSQPDDAASLTHSQPGGWAPSQSSYGPASQASLFQQGAGGYPPPSHYSPSLGHLAAAAAPSFGGQHAHGWGTEQQLPAAAPSIQQSISSSAGSARPSTADATAIVVCSPAVLQRRPVTAAFPVERLQTAMGSGLTAMRDRLKTAVERETHLRLETEMAAVDREELMHARALAEANAEMDRQARVLAEQELERLSSGMEEERRAMQREASQLRGELRASHAAIRALEKQVVSLQAELGAEVQRREAAEQQLERQIRRQTRPSLAYVQAAGEGGQPVQRRPAPPPLQASSSGQHVLPPLVQPQQGDSPSKLPFLGRLQAESGTPPRNTRTPRPPALQDVKQWLQSKQQEVAPWAAPQSMQPTPPRPRTGSFRQEAPAAAAPQQVPSVPTWQQPGAPPEPREPQGHPPAPAVPAAPRSRAGRAWEQQATSPSPSCSDPDSPERPFSTRRQQQQRQSGWSFKPAWNDGWGGGLAASPRAAGRPDGGGYRMDQVLGELSDGLEQLRRSYSPPGSPYHTSTTLPAQSPAPPPAQQYILPAPPPMQQQPMQQQVVQSSWAYQPAAAVPTAQPYGFDARPITSLLMPSLAPAPAVLPPAPAGGGGGAPIIQYISTYHSPSGSAAGGGLDPGGRPATAALPQQPQWPPGMAYGVMAAPPPPFPPPQQYQQPLFAYQPQQPLPQQMPPQLWEQRPYTPAVGLHPSAPTPGPHAAPPVAAVGTAVAASAMPPVGSGLPPASPTGVLAAGLPSRHTTGTYTAPGTAYARPSTGRPRSPGRNKDKPLAVPPQQMEEDALAAARMEYMYDKHRIKAKRMRELQESPSFSLGG